MEISNTQIVDERIKHSSKKESNNYLAYVRNILVAVIDQGVASLGTVVVLILLAKFLSKEEFGYYSLAYTTLIILSGIFNSLVINPLTIFAPSHTKEEFHKYWSGLSIITLVLSFILLVLMVITVCIMYLVCISLDMFWTFTGLTVYIIPFMFQEYIRRTLISRQKFVHTLYTDIIFTVGKLTGILLLGLCDWCSGLTAYIALSVAGLLAIVFGLFHPIFKWEIPYHTIFKIWQKHWGYGKWILAACIPYTLKAQLYPFITAGLLNVEAAGALVASSQLAGILNPAIMGIQNFMTPKAVRIISDRGRKHFKYWIYKITFYVCLVTLILCLVLTILSKDLLQLVYGGKYNRYHYVTAIAFIALFSTAVSRQFTMAIQVLERPFYITIINAVTALVTLPLAFFAISTWGVIGAAANNLLVVIFGLILGLICFSREIRNDTK